MEQAERPHLESGFLKNLRYDLPASVVVFLVALPLCLGIALASGAPLFSGIIAGIIGGVVVGILSGSELSVSGPAAGLAVIVANAIQALGSFEAFLVAVMLSGIFQIGLGFLRAGVLADYVPTSVIKGMLAAIGIVIILKQIPHALGRDDDFEGDLEFLQHVNKESTFSQIVLAIYSASPVAILISTVCLAILVFYETAAAKSSKVLSLIPAPLLVVVVGVIINEAFVAASSDYALSAADGHLVALPVSQNLTEFFTQFTLPNFSALAQKQVWIVGLTIAVVGSIETLLSVEAADRLDPFKRLSANNRELKAQGVGNFISGLLGGLPVTSVIVRSSANVYSGARTRTSAIAHGVWMFLAAMLIPSLLNRIPLACLAAILLSVGYKLASVKLFKKMYAAGFEQFLPFIVTVVAIIFTDLLVGVSIGVVIGVFFIVQTNRQSAITLVRQDNYYLMRFNKDLSFIHKAELKAKLMAIEDNSIVLIDGARAIYIDSDIYSVIDDFREAAEYRNITVEEKELDSKALFYFQHKATNGIIQKTAARKQSVG